MPMTVRDVATELGGEVVGQGNLRLNGMATLDMAGQTDLSFLTKPSYRQAALESKAGCILAENSDLLPRRTLIIVEDARRAQAEAMRLFFETPSYPSEVSTSAFVDPTARLGVDVFVAPGAFVGARAEVADGSAILSNAVVSADCRLGKGSVVHAGAVLYPRTELGERVVVHGGAVLGADGFGYYLGDKEPLKVPQVGQVVVEDEVEIGAGTCIDRATLGVTRIGARTKIDNLVQIGHNVSIGSDCVIVGQSGISGSARLGNGCRVWGQAGIRGHIVIGNDALVLARSAVTRSVAPGDIVGGNPAMNHLSWKRTIAAIKRLPKLFRDVAALRRLFKQDLRDESGSAD